MSISRVDGMWDDLEDLLHLPGTDVSQAANTDQVGYLRDFSNEKKISTSRVGIARAYFKNRVTALLSGNYDFLAKDDETKTEIGEDKIELVKEYYEILVRFLEFHDEFKEASELFSRVLSFNSDQPAVLKQLGQLAILSCSDEVRNGLGQAYELLRRLSDNLLSQGIISVPILENFEGDMSVNFENDIVMLQAFPKFNIPDDLPDYVNADFVRHSVPVLRMLSASGQKIAFQDWVRLARDKDELVRMEAFSNSRLLRSQKVNFLRKSGCRPDMFRKLINPSLFQTLRGRDLDYFSEQFSKKGIGIRGKMPNSEEEWIESIHFAESNSIVEDIVNHPRTTVLTLDKIAHVCLSYKKFGLNESDGLLRIMQAIVDHHYVGLSTIRRFRSSQFRERLIFPEEMVQELRNTFLGKVRDFFHR